MIAIDCKNGSYEVILKAIWGTVMIFNLQLKIRSVKKQQETIGRKLFKEYNLGFA